jgi:hypothetical protein
VGTAARERAEYSACGDPGAGGVGGEWNFDACGELLSSLGGVEGLEGSGGGRDSDEMS